MLSSGLFDALLGEAEDGSKDFKREPYDLQTDYGKFELAKDVVAAANAWEDFLIVLGVETEGTQDSPFERAARIRVIPRGRIDEGQYRDVIVSRCYPVPRGYTVTVYPDASDESRCLVAIHVPAQLDADRPFLVLSPLSASGQKIQGWLLGFPRRALDETEHTPAGRLHELIARGDNLGSRVEELATLVAHQSLSGRPHGENEAPESETTPESLLRTNRFVKPIAESRAEETAQEFASDPDDVGGLSASTLHLYAMPVPGVSVPTIFREDGVRQKLQNPPMTRHDGWNLRTSDRAEIVAGTRLRLRNGKRTLIELYDDGTLIVVARFERIFSRAVQQAVDDESGEEVTLVKLNPLGIIEFVHDFVLTYIELLEFMEPKPDSIAFGLGVRNGLRAPTGRLWLPPHGLGEWAWEVPHSTRIPDQDRFDWFTVQRMSETSVPELAFKLVERLYPYFKNTVDEMPYLNAARTEVDPASFGRRPQGRLE